MDDSIILGIVKIGDEYKLVVHGVVVKTVAKKGTALIGLASLIDEELGIE